MKFTIPQLRKKETPFTVNETILFAELTNLADVLEVKPALVNLKCSKVGYEQFLFEGSVSIDLIMRCSISLEPTPQHLDIPLTILYTAKDPQGYTDAIIVTDYTLDLNLIIYSEIVVGLPMKVVKEGYEDVFEKD